MNNNVRKYFFYAIGEILLVVIGILIALQVNNWNEERKERILEMETLVEISSDLESGIESLENDVELNKSIIKAIDTILESLSGEATYHDSLDAYFGELVFNTTITMNTSGYNNLKNIGFQIIEDDSLRKSITEFYENQYSFMRRYEEKDQHITVEYFTPNYLNYIKQIADVDASTYLADYTPLNFDQLKTDDEFRRLLGFLKFTKQELILNIEFVLTPMKDLKASVDQHLLTNQ